MPLFGGEEGGRKKRREEGEGKGKGERREEGGEGRGKKRGGDRERGREGKGEDGGGGGEEREGSMYYTEETAVEKVHVIYLPGPIPSAASGSISSPW